MLYVRKQTMVTIPRIRSWHALLKRSCNWRLAWSSGSFPVLRNAGKTVWVVVDGGYTKKPLLKRVLRLSGIVVVVARLRKDAALARLAAEAKATRSRAAAHLRQEPNQLGQSEPGSAWLDEVECTVYGKTSTKTYKTLLGDVPSGRRRDSRRVGERRAWLVCVLLHRSRSDRSGDR